MTYADVVRKHILADLDRQHQLILRDAAGDRTVRPELRMLDNVILSRMALLGTLEAASDRRAALSGA